MSDGARVDIAAVLFTDLVGSTELRTRVGEDAAEVLRTVHDGLVIGAIEHHRGTVVKTLGDGVMAVFTAAADAVAAGVAVQQAIDLHNRAGAGERLAVRVGMSVGDVTFDGGDCFGLPVVEAQRLEAAAEPGSIVCAELVMHLARGRGDHVFRSLGPLPLKGLPEPVSACEVRWQPLPAGPIALPELPPVLRHARTLPFSGRDDQLATLKEAWKRSLADGFEVVLLAGEPGIGKTRLTAELADEVLVGGASVLAGRCDEDVQLPFQPFVAALSWFLEQTRDEALDAALGRYPGELARLAPGLVERLPDLPAALQADPETERHRLFEAVTSWLAADAPRLLVLDDIHWADRGSLLLLRHLVAAAPSGLLVVGTYRDTDVARTHPLAGLLADLRRDDRVTRLTLSGLGASGVRDLVERVAGNELDEVGHAFARLVHEETAGNPFFLGEVLRHLAETGRLVRRDGRWTSDVGLDELGIPEGIREVIGRRLSRLGEEAEAALRAAAVIGHDFDLDVLSAVMDTSEDHALEALEQATAAGLIEEVRVGRYRFAHALVRQTLHEELSSTRRARQHRRVAETLERLHADDVDRVVPELARHWAEASAGGDPGRAVELAVRAGDQASGRIGLDEAIAWYERALELLDGDETCALATRHVLARLAQVQLTNLDPGFRRSAHRAAELALAVGDIGCAVDALTLSDRRSFDQSQASDPERLALVEQALGAVARDDPAQRGRLLAQLALELIYTGDFERRRAVIEELEEVLAKVEDPALRHRIAGPGAISVRFDTVATVGAGRDDLLASLRTETNVGQMARGWGGVYFLSCRLGDRHQMNEALDRLSSLIEAWGEQFRTSVDIWQTMNECIDGRVAESEAAVRDQYRRWKALQLPEAVTYRATGLFAVRREQDRIGDIVQPLRKALPSLAPGDATHAMVAYAELAHGNRDAAAELLDGFDPDRVADDAGWPMTMAIFTEVAVELGSDDLVRRLLAWWEPQAGLHAMTGGIYLGSIRRLIGLLSHRLGEAETADGAFAAAIAEHEAIAAPAWIARTNLDSASSLLDRGDAQTARARVEAAARAIGDLDLTECRRRVAELHARLGS